MGAIVANAENFDKLVLQSDKLVLVDFWAEWCGPCKALLPVLEDVANEMGDALTIAKVNVEESNDLAVKYQIRALPSLLLFRNGDMVAASTGALPKVQLKQWISDNLEPAF